MMSTVLYGSLDQGEHVVMPLPDTIKVIADTYECASNKVLFELRGSVSKIISYDAEVELQQIAVQSDNIVWLVIIVSE